MVVGKDGAVAHALHGLGVVTDRDRVVAKFRLREGDADEHRLLHFFIGCAGFCLSSCARRRQGLGPDACTAQGHRYGTMQRAV
jgi:hypothetical protein